MSRADVAAQHLEILGKPALELLYCYCISELCSSAVTYGEYDRMANVSTRRYGERQHLTMGERVMLVQPSAEYVIPYQGHIQYSIKHMV